MNPNSVYEKLVKVGTEWADAEQAANLLEGTLKSVKAKIAMQHKDCGMSVAESELRAECDFEYKEAREQAIKARTEAIKAKVVYQAAQAFIDAWRTVEATQRAANLAQV
jgi:hypothetical protein